MTIQQRLVAKPFSVQTAVWLLTRMGQAEFPGTGTRRALEAALDAWDQQYAAACAKYGAMTEDDAARMMLRGALKDQDVGPRLRAMMDRDRPRN